MQVEFEREALLKPVGVVANIVERRQTLPILAYILMRAFEGRTTLIGTDLEVEALAHVPAKIDEPGEVTLPAKKLWDICRALPAGSRMNLTTDRNSRIVLRSGRSRFSLSTLPVADFPKVESDSYQQVLTISSASLKSLLERTSFCMAQQDVRYYLNGLYLDFSGNCLRAVATDGHRMAIADVDLISNTTQPTQIIVPRKTIQELGRLLTAGDQTVILSLGRSHIRVEATDVAITSKLIDGKFPDYARVLPKNQSKQIQLNRDAFREALGRTAILANEKYRGVRLSLEPGWLRISANNPEQEEATEELEVAYTGEPLEIGFNVGYLLEAATGIDSEDLNLGLSDPNSSCTLQPLTNSRTQYVVMPMRL